MHPMLNKLRTELDSLFPERRHVIDGALAAVLVGEHVLFLGPPGTAKSALVRTIATAFRGTYFERLLTKFSTPEELYGPISLRALEQERFTRVTTSKLPDVQFAFIDEVFKASSAILNTLLTLMNERVFHNDGQPVQVPLVSMFGASNELPEGKELEALFDRFMLRFETGYLVRTNSLRSVLTSPEPMVTAKLSMADLKKAQTEVAKIVITDATVDALIAIRESLRTEGIVASDRRWKKSLGLVKAAAYLADESETTPEDLVILVDALWREPKERNKVARMLGQVADPVGAQAAEILDAARETSTKVQQLANADRKTYIAQAAQSLEQFKEQEKRLVHLSKGAGKRAKVVIDDAKSEITSLHAELARAVSTGLGLGMRQVK
ncbi:MAG: AAA family ATPase [Deltaproteobacteria bacterium]|nr:AAA family ATPase [Deltaproteobacteria bacterium]